MTKFDEAYVAENLRFLHAHTLTRVEEEILREKLEAEAEASREERRKRAPEVLALMRRHIPAQDLPLVEFVLSACDGAAALTSLLMAEDENLRTKLVRAISCAAQRGTMCDDLPF